LGAGEGARVEGFAGVLKGGKKLAK